MTADCDATIRGRELGNRLRRVMTAAGLNGKDMSRRLGWSESRVSRLLTGRSTARQVDIAAFLAVCGVTGNDREQMLALSAEHPLPGVFRLHGRQRFTSYRDHAATATRVTEFQTHMLPWTLHVAEYTRAVLDALVVTSPAEVDARATDQHDTTNLLGLPTSPDLRFFVHEWLLRAPFGDSAVMSAQLHHLLRLSVRSSVSLRVVPISAGAHAGGGGPFTVMEFAEYRRVVYREEEDAGVFLDDSHEIAAYRAITSRLGAVALDEQGSRELITRVAADHDSDRLVPWGGVG